MPVEPPSSPWAFAGRPLPGDDLVAIGADLEPGTLLDAYRHGLFPMPDRPGDAGGDLLWFSPVRRGILPLDGLRVSRSLRRSCRAYEVRVDTAFDAVVAGCADPRRNGRWIDAGIAEAYAELHRLGWAHSVETWHDGELVGGLYGLAIGGLFAGESMFHHATDASKVALVGLVDLLTDGGADPHRDTRLLDVQWRTDHLASLGVVEIPRAAYAGRLRAALALPLPAAFDDGRRGSVPEV